MLPRVVTLQRRQSDAVMTLCVYWGKSKAEIFIVFVLTSIQIKDHLLEILDFAVIQQNLIFYTY